MKKTIVLVIMTFLVTGITFSQKNVVGSVMNSKDKPVRNALIYLDSVNSGVTTDKQGKYSVQVPEGTRDINVYSYKYGLLSSEIGTDAVINFVFIDRKLSKKEKLRKGEKVTIGFSENDNGYFVQKPAVLEPEKAQKDALNYANIFDLIRGRVAGVVVTQDNRIRIRGVNSPNSTSEPMFIVDGTPVYSIGNILPINVKDIKILKGPDAAIYGSRGANGVIIITTKI